jgi:hypothetical protein
LVVTKKYTGKCACGAVKFEFDVTPDFIAECHCLDCKKASGGEAAVFFAVPESNFKVTSGSTKSFGYVANSGKNWSAASVQIAAPAFTPIIWSHFLQQCLFRSGAWIIPN